MFLRFILALLPIIWLAVALSVLKLPAYKVCPLALILTILLALFYWKSPGVDVLTGGVEGAVMGLWPISLVIVAAVFAYNLTVRTGAMDTIKRMLTAVTCDKRVLVLIIAWGFGGFMEGMAGFGTAVAIPAGILCGLGFNPIQAALVCLVANATPTAFGSIGIPTITAASVTGLDASHTAVVVVLQLALMVVATPLIMVMMLGSGPKALKGVWHIALGSGIAFVIPEFITARFVGAELPAVTGSVVCMAVTILLSKVLLRRSDPSYALPDAEEQGAPLTIRSALLAWSPFILILVFLLLTSNLVPPIHDVLAVIKSDIPIYTGPEASPYTISWVNTPGVLIFLAAILGGCLQKAGARVMGQVLAATVKQMSKTMITLVSILAAAKIMGYCGMTSDIAAFLVAATGSCYPFVAPLIGSIGTFVTGSATSASVLFAGLQAETAGALGMASVWLVAANTIGATAGKIISPQSISIATAATGIVGQESKILRSSIGYYVLFVAVFGLTALLGHPLMALAQ